MLLRHPVNLMGLCCGLELKHIVLLLLLFCVCEREGASQISEKTQSHVNLCDCFPLSPLRHGQSLQFCLVSAELSEL